MTLRPTPSLTCPPPSSLPLGTNFWKRTNQVRFRSPVAGCSGRLGPDVVYHIRNGKTFARPYVRPDDPKTGRQQEQRANLTAAQRFWSTLPADVRKGWDDYARRHLFPEREEEAGSGPGQNAHLRAQLYRLGWGGELLAGAPVQAPPSAPLSIEEMPAPAGMFAFRVRHGMPGVDGCRVLFELTPATATLRRKPRERELVWAGETAPDSFLPLGGDGAVYLLDRPRFDVEPGQRYGVRVRILTGKGVPGPALTADLIRRDAEEAQDPGTAEADSATAPDSTGHENTEAGKRSAGVALSAGQVDDLSASGLRPPPGPMPSGRCLTECGHLHLHHAGGDRLPARPLSVPTPPPSVKNPRLGDCFSRLL